MFIERFADVNREVVRFLKSRDARPARATGGRPKGEEPREPEGWLRGAMNVVRGWISWVKAWIGVS